MRRICHAEATRPTEWARGSHWCRPFPPSIKIQTPRSSPETNLVLLFGCWLMLFWFPSPPECSGGERSEPERNSGGEGNVRLIFCVGVVDHLWRFEVQSPVRPTVSI